MNDRDKTLRDYATGYAAALALTLFAFASVRWPWARPGIILATVLGLALVQAIVHFRFFLHIRLGRSSRHDLQLILFSALIIALMAGGTLVILANLRDRMM